MCSALCDPSSYHFESPSMDFETDAILTLGAICFVCQAVPGLSLATHIMFGHTACIVCTRDPLFT